MSEECPPKNDIAAVFKKLRSYAANKICFDCGAKNPTWSSVTYGVFICIDCSAVHRSLGVHLSFVRSTQLDTNWTWLQLRAMQLGGNSNATQFFRQHGCTTTDAQQKYKSRAAQLYREKLHHAAVAAMRMHGTKLHIETTHADPQSPSSPTQKEEPDFFAEHTTPTSDIPRNESQASISEEAYIGPRRTSTNAEEKGPNVILDDNVATEAKPAGGMIGQRRPAAKKTTGKKSAFGAQKVATDFSEIERQAEVLEKTRITAAVPATKEDTASQDAAAAAISSRFLAQESAKRDEQMKRMDPKKKEQVERLGMALGDGGRSKATHSVLADIKPIEQVDARGTSGYKVKEAEITLDDEWDIIGGSKDRDNEKTSSWARDTDKNSSWARDTDKSSNWSRSTAKNDDNGFVSSKNDYDDKSRRKTPSAVVDAPLNVDAQKKFASAKAISSEQYFGATSAPDYETRTNLSRFEGSNAISSADFFGNDSGSRGGGGGGYRSGGGGGGGGGGGAGYSSSAAAQLPDMTDIKDSVRQGVTKVAGKISQFSAGMSNYLSDHYGN